MFYFHMTSNKNTIITSMITVFFTKRQKITNYTTNTQCLLRQLDYFCIILPYLSWLQNAAGLPESALHVAPS